MGLKNSEVRSPALGSIPCLSAIFTTEPLAIIGRFIFVKQVLFCISLLTIYQLRRDICTVHRGATFHPAYVWYLQRPTFEF